MKLQRRQALAGAAGLLGLSMAPPRAFAATALPDPALLERNPETYWKRIRKEQFFLPEWRHFLNNGSLGVMPKPVFAAVADFLETGASLVNERGPDYVASLRRANTQTTLTLDLQGSTKRGAV